MKQNEAGVTGKHCTSFIRSDARFKISAVPGSQLNGLYRTGVSSVFIYSEQQLKLCWDYVHIFGWVVTSVHSTFEFNTVKHLQSTMVR